MIKKTNKETIVDFIKVHGDRYDYSLVNYINAVTKVSIICEKHGTFYIIPNSHKNGAGCYKCGREIVENSRRKSNTTFINESREVHGDRYEYDKTVYITYYDKVIITCKKHGDFKQQARKHLFGQNCKKCVSEDLMVDFISMCKIKYLDDYDYSKVEYKGMLDDVIITCKKHGDFKTRPINFYHKSIGCKKCLDRNKSKQETEWLNSLKVPEDMRNIYIKFGEKKYCVDGLDLENKIVYEYYGDFFHGNPDIYDKNDINTLLNKTYGDLYLKTKYKENIIKENGYELVTIWENDFKNKK